MIIHVLRTCALFLPPLVWAVSLQMGEIMPYADCSRGTSLTSAIAIAASACAALGCITLWRIRARALRAPVCFLDHAGLAVGLVFTFALLLQGAATLLIDPCAH